MIKRVIRATALAAALAGASSAYAIPWTLTYAGGSSSVFDGFDWASNGTLVSQGFTPDSLANQTFNMVFFAKATAILNQAGLPILGPTIATNPNVGLVTSAFEYTTVAVLQISSTCIQTLGPVCEKQQLAAIPGGTFGVYYDTSPDANQATGTGFLDGTKIIGGTVAVGGGAGGVYDSVSNTMSFAVIADTSTVDAAYINPPDLDQSVEAGILQFNTSHTGWVPSTGLPVGSLGPNTLQFQADANQYFLAQRVPEPGSLALVGLGLSGLGLFARRRTVKPAKDEMTMA